LHRTGKLGAHGEQEMNQLLQHFRASKALEDGIEVQPMVDADEATVEFSQFKSFLYGVVHDPQQTFLQPDGKVQEFPAWMKAAQRILRAHLPKPVQATTNCIVDTDDQRRCRERVCVDAQH